MNAPTTPKPDIDPAQAAVDDENVGKKNRQRAKRNRDQSLPTTGRITALTVPDDPPVPAPVRSRDKPRPAGFVVPPPAIPSRFRRRHLMVLVSFLFLVVAPACVVGWYLWTRAADQYASTVAFSVRTEENASAIASILGPLGLSGSSTSDTDILYEFIQSQNLVAKVNNALDLRTLWSKGDPKVDPVFSYHPPGTIEDLLRHWERKVKIYYDSGSGLIELRVLAFTPEDAKAIASAIYAESVAMINLLSDIAREDAISYARDELALAVERLKTAREAVTTFRNRTQIVEPTMALQGQAGLLNTLNQQLAAALIEIDLLKQTTRADDPRILQTDRKIQVIEKRIEEEKRKLGIGDSREGTEAFANLVGEYERLTVDREFAEQTYTAALAGYDAAQAEARRQSRYLAAHISPTLAEKAEYPQRLVLLGFVALFAFLIWSILVLVAYSLRDRR